MDGNKEKIIFELKNRLEEIPNLLQKNHWTDMSEDPKFLNWQKAVLRLIENFTWDKKSSYYKDFDSIRFFPSCIYEWMPDVIYEEAFEKWLESAKYTLESIINEFKMFDIQSQNNWKDRKDVTNIFNITQNQTQSQSINLDVKTIFKNQLSENQLNELENIIKEKDKNKFQKFLESLWIWLSVEMLKTLMLSIFF